ncbi:Glycosyltransferase [Mesotoga infera]|uniref:Glycosyltransferase n=1 Tax=Mesotoga infera TaxID=1236046 RepID=A0A7Z7PSC4_9BACT|nr:glycosyltransferase [Mesotoga infera]SSC13678.1 Glycosyltransferase [Mesotoga infera]
MKGIGRKVLIFSEMFPKPKNSSSGVFVIERLRVLLRFGVEFDFAPVSTFDNLLIRLLKRLKGITPSAPIDIVQVEDKQFPVISISLRLKDRIGLLRQKTDSWVKYAERMAQTIERRKNMKEFGLFHAHRVFPEGYAAMLLSKKHDLPYLVTAHGGEIHSISNNNKTAVREVLEKAAKVIFVSKALMKDACEKLGYDKSNGIVIPNGVDTNVFKPIDREEARKKIGLPLDKKIVGFVGNLIEVKGAHRLPAIARELIDLRSDVFFIIVGDGPLMKLLREKMPTKNVHFAGRVEYELMPIVMNAIDVLVVPSRQEGLGTVILEARACGARVVGTNVGGIPEAVEDEGIIVQQSEDVERELARATINLLSNLCYSCSTNEFKKKWSWQSTVINEVDTYKQILKEYDPDD